MYFEYANVQQKDLFKMRQCATICDNSFLALVERMRKAIKTFLTAPKRIIWFLIF
jgi:hypothetical protein